MPFKKWGSALSICTSGTFHCIAYATKRSLIALLYRFFSSLPALFIDSAPPDVAPTLPSLTPPGFAQVYSGLELTEEGCGAARGSPPDSVTASLAADVTGPAPTGLDLCADAAPAAPHDSARGSKAAILNQFPQGLSDDMASVLGMFAGYTPPPISSRATASATSKAPAAAPAVRGWATLTMRVGPRKVLPFRLTIPALTAAAKARCFLEVIDHTGCVVALVRPPLPSQSLCIYAWKPPLSAIFLTLLCPHHARAASRTPTGLFEAHFPLHENWQRPQCSEQWPVSTD